MLTVTDGSQVEPLIKIGTDFKMEQIVDGTFTVSFSCFPSENNPGYELLKSESIITVDGNDFRVKVFADNVYSKTVTALSIFYDRLKTYRHGTFEGSHTLNNHINFALQGTGWTFTADANIANVTNYIRSFGNDNVIKLVQKICKYHECEFQILPNKQLYFAKEIGGNYDYQYRYKHNISSIVLQEDTTNLATYIKGFGKDDLTVEYTSPNIDIFGRREEEPVKDERFTDATALLNYIKSKLQDEPQLAIETTIPELVARENGERVWLIYEPLGVEMSTRILKQTKVLYNGKLITSSVVFGNSLPKSIEDTLADQEEKIGDTNEYIDDTKEELKEEIEETKEKLQGEFRSEIKKTDDRITLEVEHINTSIAAIDIKANNINLSVNNRITNEMAAINLKADNINLSVNNRITNEVSAIDVRAGKIEIAVSNLDRDTKSAINVTQNSINLKVDKGGSITDINLSPGVATINANKINLNGAVVVDGDISGATNINVNKEITVGQNIRMSGSGTSTIYFADMTNITSNQGNIGIYANHNMDLQANYITFYGAIDFSRAYSLNGVARGHTPGIGIAYNNNPTTPRIYFRINGSNVGYIDLSK